MDLQQLLKIMPALYEAQITCHLESAPGLGKSSVMRQAADVLSEKYGEEFGFIDRVLPTVDAQDLKGYLIPHKNDDGTATSMYTQPDIIRAIEESGCDRGILMLDEFRQAEQLTQKAAAEIILDRKIGDYHLPEGWYVAMASNRSKDKSGAGRSMAHITNRVATIGITPSIQAWSAWAADNQVHPMGVAFAKSRPGVVFGDGTPANPDDPFCTARSFTRAMQLISTSVGTDATGNPIMNIETDSLMNEVVNAIVGESAGAEMSAYFKCAELMPTYDEMMADPEGCKLPPGSRLDAQYGVSAMIVHYAVSDNVGSLFKVANRLVKELQTSTVLDLLKKSGGTLMNSQALNKWISENRTLISASM